MINSRQWTTAVLAGVVVLAASGCGGKSKPAAAKTTAATGTTTTATGTTTTGTTPAPASPTKPASKSNQPSLANTPAKTLIFAGSGVKEIGKPNPLRIPKDSTIEWTNDGAIFQIIPASVHVQSPVNSTAHSGTARLRKGAYYGFLINAVGNWTVKIVPGG